MKMNPHNPFERDPVSKPIDPVSPLEPFPGPQPEPGF